MNHALLFGGTFWSFVLAAAGAEMLDFNRDVRPVLSDNCYFCHGPDEQQRKGKLRLDTAAGVAKVINPSHLGSSELLKRIFSKDPEDKMPPQDTNISKDLTPEQREILKRWVEAGAPFAKHWAFEPPQRPKGQEQGIDDFLLAKLQQEGLAFSPPADKSMLLRRVTFDLTGLPPMPVEVDAFLADKSPGAYERVVDRLLASPRFGERMALAWMDLARYGDSSAMHADGPRDMWPWRDWVINAYNRNLPFDQFTIEQLAGDLLPNATTAQKVASGFNRNNVSSDEGGAIPEELRVEYAVDRVKTTSNTWLALSMECAQCHDHKYDPLTMRDYYQLFAYFNQAADPGMQTRGGNQAPVVQYDTPEQESMVAEAQQAAKLAQEALAQRKAAAEPEFQKWLAGKQQKLAKASAALAPNDLAQCFPLDEQTGTTVRSLTGLELTLAGKLESAPREAARGLKFDGGTTLTCQEGGPELERDRPFSFSAWVKLPSGGSGGALFSRMDEANQFRGWDFWVQGTSVGTHIISSWPANAIKVVSKTGLKPDKWTQVVVAYDGGSKASGVRIFLDGKLMENSVEQDSLTGSIATAVPFKIGSRSNSSVYKGEADDLRIYRHALTEEEVKQLGDDPVASILATAVEARSKDHTEFLRDHFLATADAEAKRLGKAYGAAVRRVTSLRETKVTSMIMTDEKAMRPTFILNRGQYDQPKKDTSLEPGIPAIFGTLPPNAPKNRLGLAQWLVSPSHPLTARVAVNRFWQLLFGEGLVKTLEDFGAQGEVPSHPELLDWLATDFVHHGWDVKRMIRQMVLSAAYGQSSRATSELRERDPENRWWARGPRFRLQGEFLRDNALSLSGLMVEKIGGPSVKPYQPPGIWEEVALEPGGTGKFVPDHGEKLYRRSMYTYWKRSAPHPTLMLFDAPTREKCTARRMRTNTPLQALATLNDPQFVEAARAFGQRLIAEGGPTAQQRIDHAFHLALGRHASAKEVTLLTQLLQQQRERFLADPKKAEEFLKVGESERDAAIPAVEHAAWAVVASTILNLDEVLTRG